ncbi:ABC transporter permease [Hwanghaeella sp.]|uniref:ABC transporter permease n=1 Tax=Hwanghaeella sp. TaxID=2605943 RepID=UPI003CCC222B
MALNPAIERPKPSAFSPRRIGALVLRYVYILRGSWPRLIELAYWPLVQLVIWGFLSNFLREQTSWVAQAAGVLVSAVLLWDVFFRGQIGFSVSFMEEMYSRNLASLFVTPLRPLEFVAALISISLLRVTIGALPAALLAIPMFDVSIFDLGLPLFAFFANLMIMSWALGLFTISLLLRAGLGAENFAWFIIFLLAPVACVYYPVTTLPDWLQWVAWSMPMVYVFEGMRHVLFEGTFRADLFLGACALNLVYFGIGTLTFLWSFRVARDKGQLLQIGE